MKKLLILDLDETLIHDLKTLVTVENIRSIEKRNWMR